MKIVPFSIVSLFLLALSACSSTPPPRPVTESFTTAQKETAREYKIQRGDLLDVKFFYNPELNDQVTVRPDGKISLQLAKEINAEGMTPAQLTDALTSHYAPLIKNPEITIIVRSFMAQRVFVDGEVTRAGVVVLNDPMTVLQAISQAGGLKETAQPAAVMIIRRTDDNRYVTAKVDLSSAMEGKGLSNDVTLLPNDIVLVPRSGIANVDLWVDQYIRKLIPVPIGVGLGY
nr:polysaccharide biosynthesis/export family protein [Geomonas sp. RF6]